MSDDDAPPNTLPGIRNRDDFPDDTIKILLATDNHIGYMERDPVRGQDSIDTFREILQLAVKHDVDFVLLAGDLFHENKPSRDCLYKTIALLREYTLGDKPVQVELLSDPDEGQAEGFSFPAVNYEDPNFNVSIPVFSIHGNHDDPQGAGAEGALCALDVLSVTGLINYMGKIDLPISDADANTTGIAVRPVLLRKGNTYLGMYGIGNVKDQRMHFELRSNRVRMYMPKDKQTWFNMILLHQNRVKHGPQDFVPEGLFDDSVDLVVWGHEHDCRIVPEPVAGKQYYITQPGSSVATSLADGEAIDKHVALLQIQGKEFELKPLPLRTVRPFVIESIVLSEIAEEENLNLSDQMEITKYLKNKVNALIAQANEQWEERNTRAVEDGEEALPPMLPLIRLKVDTTGVSEMSNPIRFGQEFQGRLANPRDVLVFHRSKKSAARSGKVNAAEPDLEEEDPAEAGLTSAEKLARVRVQTLVRKHLEAQELQLLGEMEMSDAIAMFVEKDDTHAIQSYVSKAFKKLTKSAQATNGDDDVDEDDVDEMLAKAKAEQDQQYAEKVKEAQAARTAKGKGKSKAASAESDDSMMVDEPVNGGGSDFDDDAEPAPAKKKPTAARATKAPAKGKGKGKAAAGSDDSDSEPAPPKKKTAAKATATKAKAPAKKAPAKRGKKAVSESDDDIIELDTDSDEVPAKKTTAKKAAPAKKKAPAQSQATFPPTRSSRAAATKARGKMVVEDDESDD
ncbi:Metallo-dependent phosphatase-like protein [Mycena pura]|uniref:Double-strand break repair protein n=1 Tax=Mycena pura TaxID=153505 RepID=A0AAD6V6K9_9AGAR|nr:Metallo-dependent phosphatase-like protein [Mycena pura]